MITFIYGPPGSGKTRNSAFLKQKYGCKRVVEAEEFSIPLEDGDLVLLQARPLKVPAGAQVIDIREALA